MCPPIKLDINTTDSDSDDLLNQRYGRLLERDDRIFVIIMEDGDYVMISSFMALSQSLNDIQKRLGQIATKEDLIQAVAVAAVVVTIFIFLIVERVHQNLASMIQDICLDVVSY